MPHIFVHGLGQNPSSWDKVLSCMAKPFPSECPDLSALLGDREITYANLYSAFSDYCNHRSGPFELCGLSIGGVIALHYATDHPANVHSLTLIGAQYKMPKAALRLQNIIFGFMPESAFKNMGFKKKDFIQLTNSMMDLDFSDKLKDISCATLILCGNKDGANKKAAQGLAKNISGAELRLVENAGHAVNVDNPEKLAAELEAFYRKL